MNPPRRLIRPRRVIERDESFEVQDAVGPLRLERHRVSVHPCDAGDQDFSSRRWHRARLI